MVPSLVFSTAIAPKEIPVMKAKLATLAVFLCTGIASADITVTGNGKIVFVPNLAHVSVGVSSDGKTAAEAWQANAEIVKKLFQALRDQNIDPKDMKTTGLNVSPKYIYPKDKKPQLVGYTVSYNLEVVIRKLDHLGETLDALVANGANRGMNLTFAYDNMDALIDQARMKAVADARHKADLYVKGAGAHLGAVVTISDYQPVLARPFYYEHAAKAGTSLPIATGEQEFTVNVTVTYTIENG
jgi:uncharacterized protein YggE